jgi:dihydrolipoamide dehydrogenase
MAENFDLVVLGSGPGGYVAAIRASQLGMTVAIVERERLGGICLNWGCIPTKALLRTSEIYHYMQNASAYGLSATGVSFDLAKITERSRKVAGQLNSGVKSLMKKNKITVVEGTGALTAATQVTVTTGDQTRVLTGKNVIIATGARARDLPGLKADGERVWTYRHAMVPPAMPTRLLVIGSGAIGVEFASFYSDMGAEVTIVEMLDRILPVEDEEVSAFRAKALAKQGMRILTGAKVSDVTPGKDAVAATITTSDGKAAVESFSHVIVAIGIVPNTENIGLEALGVATDRGHIVNDGFGRTNVPGLWAIGDVAGAHHCRGNHGRAACAPARQSRHPGLHLFPPAGGERGVDRGQGQGCWPHGQGWQVSLHRQWQGDCAR